MVGGGDWEDLAPKAKITPEEEKSYRDKSSESGRITSTQEQGQNKFFPSSPKILKEKKGTRLDMRRS